LLGRSCGYSHITPASRASRCGTIWQTEEDDPEKRIRELERGLADATPVAPASGYDLGFAPPRRKAPLRWGYLVVGLAILVPIVIAIAGVAHLWDIGGGNRGPITLPRGGTLNVGGNEENETVACNDGSLTLSAVNSTVSVTGHCASLRMSGFDNHVSIENADTVEVSGYSNAITHTTCNDGKLTLSGYNNAFSVGGHCASLTVSNYGNRVQVDSIDIITVNNYGNRFSVTGHCGSLKVSAYDNQVQVDSADTIDVSGYSNTVTYHSGSPKITQSGYDVTVKQG
jgi:Protein of unknown function (DUF3060)